MCVFSVIIPVYNVEKYIEKCVSSVLFQSFVDFELICVNDCSTDSSLQILNRLAEQDSRMKVINLEKNSGVSIARNTGIDASTGEYIVFVDSDDWLEPHHLKTVYNAFLEHPDVTSVLFDAYKYLDNEQRRALGTILSTNSGYLTITAETINNYSDYPWAKVYRANSIKDNKLYFPPHLTFEDGEFYFKYFAINPKLYILDDALYNYRVREGSIVTNAQAGNVNLSDMYQVVKNVRDFYIEKGIYSEYKRALLHLLSNRIQTCKTIRNNYEKSIQLSKKLIEDFGGFKEFEDFNEKSEPLFSIIIPVYNVEKYLRKCLDSLLFQTLDNFEVICIDDCSTDSSREILEEYAAKDSRFKTIFLEQNGGQGIARNIALNYTNGKYLVCIDPDDWVRHDFLSKIQSAFSQHDVDSVWFKFKMFWEGDKFYDDMVIFPDFEAMPEGHIIIDENNISSFSMYSINKVVKRDKVLKSKALWSEKIIFEDVEFYYRYFVDNPKVYLLNDHPYYYRRHGDSSITTCTYSINLAKDLFSSLQRVYDFLKSVNLYDKHKESFYRLVDNHMNMLVAFPKINKELLPYKKEFLDLIKD